MARRNEDQAKGAFLCTWFSQSGGLHEPPRGVFGLREADSEDKVLGTSADRVRERGCTTLSWMTPDIHRGVQFVEKFLPLSLSEESFVKLTY